MAPSLKPNPGPGLRFLSRAGIALLFLVSAACRQESEYFGNILWKKSIAPPQEITNPTYFVYGAMRPTKRGKLLWKTL